MTSTLARRFYDCVILPTIWGGSSVLSLVQPKIRTGLTERAGLIERVCEFRRCVGERSVVLFHAASAGEIEGLKPVAREFDRNRMALALSYFSPSARAALRAGDDFDFADYSPIDCAARVAAYLDALRPALVAITKHDVWPNFAWAVRDRGIPLFFINGSFPAGSLRLWPGARQFHRAVYAAFSSIMTVSEEDAMQVRRIVADRVAVEVLGDSRFDRVLARIAASQPLPDYTEDLCAGRKVIVAGSTHIDDERLLLPVLRRMAAVLPDMLAVIVPHDPSPAARRRILALCAQSRLKARDLDDASLSPPAQVVIVNRSGILADLYRVGHVAYVGGGFGRGVHSVLEPMAASLPVLCGPNMTVSCEARAALHEGILSVVTGPRQLEASLRGWLRDDAALQTARESARDFVRIRSGASVRIADRLKEALRV